MALGKSVKGVIQSKVYRQVHGDMWIQVGHEVEAQTYDEVYYTIEDEVFNRIDDQIDEQVRDQLWWYGIRKTNTGPTTGSVVDASV